MCYFLCGTWWILGDYNDPDPHARPAPLQSKCDKHLTPTPNHPATINSLLLQWVCVKDVVNFAHLPLSDKVTKPYVMYVKHIELRPQRLSINSPRPAQPYDQQAVWHLHPGAHLGHRLLQTNPPPQQVDSRRGTATWRWCLRCDCNHSPDRCHHPTAWQGRSGSCWCPGATLPCGELPLPFPAQGGPHGWGWHDSLLSVFQMAPRTMHHRRVRHEGHTVVDLHTMSLPTFSCVCPQCDIGTNAGQHVTNIGD